MDLKETALLGERAGDHWYYRAKLAALERATSDIVPGHVVDVGAGSGFFSRAMMQSGRAQTATCVDPGYPVETDETVAGRILEFRKTLSDESAQADVILMMDVLEHVEDDIGLVREYADRMRSGARFIITVPAFQWLWSGHDVYLEHYRRYTLSRLEHVLREAGLKIEFGSYLYGAVLPAAAGVRLLRRLRGERAEDAKSDMRMFGPVLNTLFWNACRAELPFFTRNRVAGLSVFARAMKP